MNNILIFGDSITAGKGVDKNKSWASKLVQMLDVLDKKNTLVVHNLGVAGESTQELLKRCATEIKKKCCHNDNTLIIIAIGINDSKGINSISHLKTPLTIFDRNINALINIVKKYSNNLVFMGLTPVNENKTFPLGNNYFLNKNIEKYNNRIKNICKKEKINFVKIFENWTKENYKNFLTDDGLHLNELGHQNIFEKVVPFINLFVEKFFDPFEILKKEYFLKDKDIKAIEDRFIKNKVIKNNLFIGQFFKQKPTVIIGAPCIRKDIEGISLNTFYQIFMPMKIASILQLPCKIFLGVKEETIFQPKLFYNYQQLGNHLERAIKKLGKELGVETEVINTSYYRYDLLIEKCVKNLNVQLSSEESTYLFNLSLKKPIKPLHSTLRIITNKRIIACNTFYSLKKLFGENNYLIVEDIEQHTCALFAKKFDKKISPNFLAFLPLPNTSGTSSMFKSKKEERFLLNQSEDYYKTIFKKSPKWVINIYKLFFDLFEEKDIIINKNTESVIKIIKKISNYFL